MISARYAPMTVVLLAIAAVPTMMHSYVGADVVDGLTAEAIPLVLDGRAFTATGRKRNWVRENFGSDDWVERTHGSGRQEVRLFVGRSLDAKRLYHHPELALLRGIETTPKGVSRASARPDVPLHVVATERGGLAGTAVYALLHDGRFVDRPILFQLQTSARLLFTGRRPMTLFLAADFSGSSAALDDAPATRVLLEAIRAFESQPRPTEPS